MSPDLSHPLDPPAGADEPLDDLDRRLIAAIHTLQVEYDDVPSGLLERLQFAVSLELMQAELATLAEQSLAPIRAETTEAANTLTFTASSTSLMIVITPMSDAVRVDGWVTGGGIEVALHTANDVIVQVSDATGRLTWPSVPHGSVRFLIRSHREGVRPVVTPNIEV